MCFTRSRQNHLSRYHAIISCFSRLPSRKIKTLVPQVYLIPSLPISKHNSRYPVSKSGNTSVPKKPCWAPCLSCKIFFVISQLCNSRYISISQHQVCIPAIYNMNTVSQLNLIFRSSQQLPNRSKHCAFFNLYNVKL